MNLDDTIVAIATAPGRGGIGVVRLSGSEARAIAASLLRFGGEPAQLADFEHARARLGEVVESNAQTALSSRADAERSEGGVEGPLPGEITGGSLRLDEVVVTYFAAPHSYTTEDVVEISAHGSPVVLRHIVELAVARGARPAEPGEFTMRAFLNGRIDLTQAEAVRDLIEARTLYQARVAAQQLEGALSHRLQPIKQRLVELIAGLEAGIDFADDDVPVMPDTDILAGIAAVRAPLEALAQSFAYGKLVHEGLTLAIVGRPNVGKSSLFNRLVERERAIVTATPGTTRDLVSETVALGGIPVRLVDTAGIRESVDEAESIGVRKSREALADADLVLLVVEAPAGVTGEDRLLLNVIEQRPAIVVANKCDLNSSPRVPHVSPVLANVGSPDLVRTSALTGEGIDRLRSEILRRVGADAAHEPAGMLTNVRHQALVHDSLKSLQAALAAVENKTPHEALLLDLYGALRPLDDITGATTADDILNLIFGSFCIGK